jgi:hypothetical protein
VCTIHSRSQLASGLKGILHTLEKSHPQSTTDYFSSLFFKNYLSFLVIVFF